MRTGTLVVSIGGNIDDVPMSETQWGDFKVTLRSLLADLSGYTVFAGHGDGVWEGKAEDAYTVIVAEVEGQEVVRLRPALARLCAVHSQECIAVTFGSTTFVRPEV